MAANIRRQYVNPKFAGSFSGLSGFLKNRKFKNRKDVVNELNQLEGYTLHKPARKIYPRRKVIIPFKDYQWVGDIMDMQKFSNENRGYRYVLILVDGLGKFLFNQPVKSKSAPTVLRGFQTVLRRSKRKPTYLQFDMGREVKNKIFLSWLKKQGITMFHTYTHLKAILAERVLRTIRSRIERMFTYRGNHKYIDALQQLTSSYNGTYHSSIKMKPSQVNRENENDVWLNLYEKSVTEAIENIAKPQFALNDLVRISRFKAVFFKGYTKAWSDEIFKIIKINNTYPITYSLADMNGEGITGGFLEPELQIYTPS